MCFSANVSFGAGLVVATAGILSTRKVKCPEQIMFAAIPLIFAVQQMIEGWVWLTFTHDHYAKWQPIPVTMFLLLAQIVWPLWVPFSILNIEPKHQHRKLLKIMCFFSLVLAPLQGFRLLFYPPSVEITSNHIHYGLDSSIPLFAAILNAFYVMTTTVPPFLSSRKSVFMLGTLNLIALIITLLAYRSNIISIWCFFAAILSWQVIQAMRNFTYETKVERLPN